MSHWFTRFACGRDSSPRVRLPSRNRVASMAMAFATSLVLLCRTNIRSSSARAQKCSEPMTAEIAFASSLVSDRPIFVEITSQTPLFARRTMCSMLRSLSSGIRWVFANCQFVVAAVLTERNGRHHRGRAERQPLSKRAAESTVSIPLLPYLPILPSYFLRLGIGKCFWKIASNFLA